MNDFLGLPAWAWVAAALAALAGVAWLVRGRYRQLRARRAIDNVISAVAYDELRDVLLPTGAGDEIHLHYLLLTERGLLVIDLFDVAGLIFAGEKIQKESQGSCGSAGNPQDVATGRQPVPVMRKRFLTPGGR